MMMMIYNQSSVYTKMQYLKDQCIKAVHNHFKLVIPCQVINILRENVVQNHLKHYLNQICLILRYDPSKYWFRVSVDLGVFVTKWVTPHSPDLQNQSLTTRCSLVTYTEHSFFRERVLALNREESRRILDSTDRVIYWWSMCVPKMTRIYLVGSQFLVKHTLILLYLR